MSSAWAAGFGLYEMSARAMMNGGHRMGKAVDGSAVYYNPATQTGLTGTWITAGTTFLHPPLDTRVNGVGTGKMNPGWFCAPHFFVTQELPADFNFGLGGYADFGLGSKYHDTWPLAWDSVQSDVQVYTVSPTLAYKVTDKWSVAGGVRLSHMTFQQKRIFRWAQFGPAAMYNPALAGYDSMLGSSKVKYTARNDVDVGYVLATTYDVTDDFAVGALWRSRERVRLQGHCSSSGDGLLGPTMAETFRGEFEEKLDLPMSAQVGFNWDKALGFEKLHLGASCIWTEWSTIDSLSFGGNSMELGWHNAYRTGFGLEYDLSEDWTAGVGYAYDWDPTRERRPASMLPAGDRHNVTFGLTYHITPNWDVSLSGGMVLMESKTAWFDNPVTHQKDVYKLQTRNSHTYLAMATVSYHF